MNKTYATSILILLINLRAENGLSQTYEAGLPCANQPGALQSHASDNADDLLACINNIWVSMLFNKASLPPNKSATASVSFSTNHGPEELICSGITDAAGKASLEIYTINPFVNDLNTGVLRINNLLVDWQANGGSCGAILNCSADGSGLNFTGSYTCFGPSITPVAVGLWH